MGHILIIVGVLVSIIGLVVMLVQEQRQKQKLTSFENYEIEVVEKKIEPKPKRRIKKAGFIRIVSDNPHELKYRTEENPEEALKILSNGDIYIYGKLRINDPRLGFEPIEKTK